MELNEKTVLVLGGGSGIGLAIASALAREGCRVAIAGRGEKRLADGAAQCSGPHPVLTHTCDVSDRRQVADLVQWFEGQLGPPDILVNSAGINVACRAVAELDPADWDRLLAINVTGAFNCLHAVLPGMRKRGAGLIIHICSIAGKRALEFAGVGYCASKFAMGVLGTSVNLEEQQNGIRVSTIYPGEVNTPILEHRPVPVPAEKRAQMLQPEDVAACVLTICKLPDRVIVPELVVTPSYQHWS